MKKQAFYSSAGAMGDLISATPTIKKLSQIFQSPITVISKHPYLFNLCPYVDESLHFDDYSEQQLSEKYDIHKSFFLLGKQDSLGVEFKHAMCDIRQFHAKDLGFMLTPEEMTCDYFPKSDDSCLSKINLPEKYVVIHPAQSWDSRTWSKYNWQALVISLEELGIPVVSIGKDAREESDFSGTTQKPVIKLDIRNGLDLTNQTTLDQSWHIINKAHCVITMDSGILHLAGTTDVNIIQLGSSIKPEYRAPWRKNSQSYKYSYIVGGCQLHCASDLKYSLRDWGHIQAVTLIGTCLEKKPSFECNPSYIPVLEEIKNIWNKAFVEVLKIEKEYIEPRTLVEIVSDALGDNIGAMSIIEKWRKETGKKITVICNHPDLFRSSYRDMMIYKKSDTNIKFTPEEGIWHVNNVPHTERINTTYKFDVPLLDGYAKDFNISSKGAVLKVDSVTGERPIKAKYVCIGVHSTSQCKYWNHPGAWDELCRMLRKKDLTPVVVEKDFSFGIQGHMNEVPSKALKKIGLPFNQVLNYIQHAEMFIGLSSGLTWIAQGLGKPTVIISNVTSKDNEYINDKTLRIYEESVCHGCFHKYPFNSGDWLWCPVYRDDDDRRFICTKAITPEAVMKQIENFYNI